MVINKDETKLRTIVQPREFLDEPPRSALQTLSKDGDSPRYEQICRVLKRFDYPQRSKRERGVVT